LPNALNEESNEKLRTTYRSTTKKIPQLWLARGSSAECVTKKWDKHLSLSGISPFQLTPPTENTG